MSIEVQADSLNQDGSVTIKVDGKDVKFVKEADLGAVKVQLKDKETEITGLQTKLTDANTKFDTEHQSLLQERTAKEQFEKTAGESETHKTKAEELTTEVANLKKVGGENETNLAERIRTTLVAGYKVDAEKIKEMPLAELVTTENTLRLTGPGTPIPANYDGKGTGGSPGANDLTGKSPLQLAQMGYDKKKE